MLIHERDCKKTFFFFFSSVTAKIWLAILPSFLLTRRWFQQLNYLWVSAYEFCNIVSKNLTLFFLYLFAVWIKLLDLQLSDSNFRRTVSESLLIQFMQNWKCLRGFRKSFQRLISPGKLWTFILTFSSTGKSWEKTTDPGKSLQSA